MESLARSRARVHVWCMPACELIALQSIYIKYMRMRPNVPRNALVLLWRIFKLCKVNDAFLLRCAASSWFIMIGIFIDCDDFMATKVEVTEREREGGAFQLQTCCLRRENATRCATYINYTI